MITKLSRDRVLLLHKLIAQETGGSVGLRDEALLDAALEAAFGGFGDTEFYPSKEEKGARIGYSLISNHAFVDGNKRIGMYVMLTFLETNGIKMTCEEEEVVRVGLAIADGSMSYKSLVEWIHAHEDSIQTDSFYSKENVNHLTRIAEKVENGSATLAEHELIDDEQ